MSLVSFFLQLLTDRMKWKDEDEDDEDENVTRDE